MVGVVVVLVCCCTSGNQPRTFHLLLLLLPENPPHISMSRSSAVDRITGLFFRIFLTPVIPTVSCMYLLVAPVSTGLSSLLALSVVEAKLWRCLASLPGR
jgi:hypothetical protein